MSSIVLSLFKLMKWAAGAEVSGPLATNTGNQKRVRFSQFPEIHGEIPWNMKTGAQKALNDDVLYPVQSSFKDSTFSLRPEMNEEDSMSLCGVFILVICLIALFALIWFIVNKILLLEIENQVAGATADKLKNAAKSYRLSVSGLR